VVPGPLDTADGFSHRRTSRQHLRATLNDSSTTHHLPLRKQQSINSHHTTTRIHLTLWELEYTGSRHIPFRWRRSSSETSRRILIRKYDPSCHTPCSCSCWWFIFRSTSSRCSRIDNTSYETDVRRIWTIHYSSFYASCRSLWWGFVWS
jgi:hypothetical protein